MIKTGILKNNLIANNIIQVKTVIQLVKNNIRGKEDLKEKVITIVEINNTKIVTVQVNRSTVRGIMKKK